MRKKKVTNCGQRHKKTRLKAPQRVAGKNFSSPTYDTSISHLDPMIFNYHHIRKLSEQSEMETIEQFKIQLDQQMRELFYWFKNVSGNTGDPNKIAYL